MRRNAKRSKKGFSRNLSSTMPEDCVVFFIDPDDDEFKRTMKTGRRKLEIPMPSRNDLQTSTGEVSIGKHVAQLKNTRQNTFALLKLVNLWGNAWKDLLTRITKIILQEKGWIHWTGIISITNDGSKRNGYHLETTGKRRTSSRCSICLNPGENGRCSKIIENSHIGMSRHLDTSTTTQMA